LLNLSDSIGPCSLYNAHGYIDHAMQMRSPRRNGRKKRLRYFLPTHPVFCRRVGNRSLGQCHSQREACRLHVPARDAMRLLYNMNPTYSTKRVIRPLFILTPSKDDLIYKVKRFIKRQNQKNLNLRRYLFTARQHIYAERCNSRRQHVCLSVTLWYCIKTTLH